MLRPRPLLVALSCAVTCMLAAGGCTTSQPAQLEPTGSSTADVAPAPSPTESLLPADQPTGSAVGTLAPDFPATLLPLPEGATVLVSSAVPVPDSDLVDVSLNLRTSQSTKQLLSAVRKPLLAAGFTETEPADKEPDLAAQASFTRDDGKERVILGILDLDDVRTLTLSGRVDPDVP
ncbi:hypothetical protein [Cellulomonas rhizosphaerae]|uniref:hypothetical protein n=1 Tax=Cellulomonas rhizosphaerae TaxID=2293719 RepID=UPI001F2EAF95|nr:hypothetical protein [Cellulomonas rhizosphaerae]